MNKRNSLEFGGVTPNLVYEKANEVLDWLQRVCSFQESARYVDQGGVVQQADVNVGKSEVWL